MVIDSHALYWWFDDSGKLSPKAREVLSGIGSGKDVFHVSAVTFWLSRCQLWAHAW
jgi:PIN domain nuclease of toxin-antitoxin system